MIFTEIFIELLSEFSYVISISPKKKKERRKNPSKEYFELQPISNSSNGSIHSQTFQIVTEPISRHVCVSFSNRSKRTFQFSRNENLHLFSHTHIYTRITKGCTQKVTRCRGQLLRSFHHPSFYFVSWLRFIVANPFLFVSQTLNHASTRIFIAFHRSFVSMPDRRIDPYDICPSVYICCADEEYLWGVNEGNSFVELFSFLLFSFVCWRDCCYFFHRVMRIIDHLESCWKYSKRR